MVLCRKNFDLIQFHAVYRFLIYEDTKLHLLLLQNRKVFTLIKKRDFRFQTRLELNSNVFTLLIFLVNIVFFTVIQKVLVVYVLLTTEIR